MRSFTRASTLREVQRFRFEEDRGTDSRPVGARVAEQGAECRSLVGEGTQHLAG